MSEVNYIKFGALLMQSVSGNEFSPDYVMLCGVVDKQS